MRHNSVVSGHPKSTRFHRLTGCQWDPQVLGCHSLVSELRYINIYDSIGTSLDHAFVVHFDDLICVVYWMILCYMLGKWYMENECDVY